MFHHQPPHSNCFHIATIFNQCRFFSYEIISLVTTNCGSGSSVGIATGYGLDDPGTESRWERDLPLVHIGPGTHPASCTVGSRSFPGVKSGRDVTLTTHPLLVPWSRKSRTIPLLPLWAVRPVQSLSTCTQGYILHFNYQYIQHKRNIQT